MPARDGTGPFGTGPVGRGVCPCSGYGVGYPFGRGMRRGWRFWAASPTDWDYPLPTTEEKKLLQNQKTWLQRRLEAITRRLQELDKSE